MKVLSLKTLAIDVKSKPKDDASVNEERGGIKNACFASNS
jgi:hypothetical protein